MIKLVRYSSDQSIDTVQDFVRIIDYKNLQAVIIENTDLAATFKQIFEMLWARV